jgi:hypothetical protein
MLSAVLNRGRTIDSVAGAPMLAAERHDSRANSAGWYAAGPTRSNTCVCPEIR